MIAATTLAIFVVPVLYTLITRLSFGRKLKKIREEQRNEEELDKKIIGEGLG
jgi:HAE1 family hydrophobic/amphiphilic exporter-1